MIQTAVFLKHFMLLICLMRKYNFFRFAGTDLEVFFRLSPIRYTCHLLHTLIGPVVTQSVYGLSKHTPIAFVEQSQFNSSLQA